MKEDGNKAPMIYGLIGQAMKEIRAVGKDSTATNGGGKAMYKFRGIDAVYNALNPVMGKYGIFVTPEIVEQTREERQTANGTRLVYTVLTVKYTVWAPDGSSITMTVLGEGMDSGDKSANKAMSIALKYAMFQLFMIPTEEMADPDADVYEGTLPKGKKPAPAAPKPQQAQAPQQAPAPQQQPAPAPAPQQVQRQQAPAVVTTQQTAPPPAAEPPKPAAPQQPTPAGYLLNEISFMAQEFGIADKRLMNAKFAAMRKALIADGTVPDVPRDQITMEQAKALVDAIRARYLNGGNAA